jgi:hypothetical protein
LCLQGKSPHLRDYCDFGITNIVNVSEPHLIARISAANIAKELVPKHRFLDFKGVVDIDGNSNAWSGLFCGLLTGACILKVASARQFQQWYYRDIRPWEHYLPVSSDLNDLPDAVLWMFKHEKEAKKIGERGRNFALAMSLGDAITAAAQDLQQWLLRSSGAFLL